MRERGFEREGVGSSRSNGTLEVPLMIHRRALSIALISALLAAAAAATTPSVLAARKTPHGNAWSLSGSGAAAKAGAIRFGSPTIVDTVHTYGEPDVKIAPDGT